MKFTERFFNMDKRDFDIDLLDEQRQLLHHQPSLPPLDPVPETHVEKYGSFPPSKKSGVLILAGGMGTRLGYEKPKGCFPILGKSLFEHILDKIPKSTHIAIATSPLNHDETKAFFEEKGNFGREIDLFEIGMLPLLSDEESWLYNDRGELLLAPNGNGLALHHFYESGIFSKWVRLGYGGIHVVPIDNPLVDPISSQYEDMGVELVLEVIQRKSPKESLGIVGLEQGQLTVQEYSEIEGDSSHILYANTGHFWCDFTFVEKILHQKIPLHVARKEGKWKFEFFIFDFFPFASSFRLILSEREKSFIPLKSQEDLLKIEKALA